MTPEAVRVMINQAMQRNSTDGKLKVLSACPVGSRRWNRYSTLAVVVKGNDVVSYTQRFQELALMCTKFVPGEKEKAIELANDLMDQKLRTYAERQTESKRKFDNNKEAQQLPKRQNVKGNDVVSYTQRFQELALMCTKFVPGEKEKVEKYIDGLPLLNSALMQKGRLKARENLITTKKLNNFPRGRMWLNLTPFGLVKGMSMLELFYCATSASFATMARVLQNARTARKELKVLSACPVGSRRWNRYSILAVIETLKKKMTDKYCQRGEINKLEIKLWNLKVKGNDVVSYTQRFQELALMCTKFVPDENEKVDKYIGGLLDNIHGNVMSARPKTLDEAIEQTESKRKFDNNNQTQQLPKRHNVAQAYAVGIGERNEYAGTLPLCNKCKFHHNGPCTTKCVNCKKVGHLTRD
uniref:Retrotransposon gag domain-containing protein n=1 Tax=Tanacetum cinerariifolium TaxID=118510 RepID=A0A6L2NZ10_TANCI|nr:hypothetical protein [Tanacetum cinerariifolium]